MICNTGESEKSRDNTRLVVSAGKFTAFSYEQRKGYYTCLAFPGLVLTCRCVLTQFASWTFSCWGREEQGQVSCEADDSRIYTNCRQKATAFWPEK